MPRFANGVQLAEKIAENKFGPQIAKAMQGFVGDKFKDAYPQGNLPEDYRQYHAKALEIMNACKNFIETDYGRDLASSCIRNRTCSLECNEDGKGCRAGVLEPVILNFLNMNASQYSIDEPNDLSAGQAPYVFSAGPSSMSPMVLFGSGFGLHMNATCKSHVKQYDDFVPFAYLLARDNIPAMMIFWEAHLPNGKKATHLDKQARVAYRRMERYVDQVRHSSHYAGDRELDPHVFEGYRGRQYYEYHHIGDKRRNGESRVKIPIVTGVYDGEDQTFRAVFKDADKTLRYDMRMVDFIDGISLRKQDPRADLIIGNLLKNEENFAYPKLAVHGHSIKQTDCVDGRLWKGYYNVGWLIKEIGSAASDSGIIRHASSILADASAVGTHTSCGYNHTLLQFHMAFAELDRMIGDRNPQLRKLIVRSLQRLSDGETGVLFGSRELDNAIDELENERMAITKKTADLLKAFISDSANDTRETLKHALERELARIDKSGYFTMPTAAQLEERLGDLLGKDKSGRGEWLHPDHFDYLLAEATNRKLQDRYEEVLLDYWQGVLAGSHDLKVQDGNGGMLSREEVREHIGDKLENYIITGLVTDLNSSRKFVPKKELPSTREELFGMERELYYKPGEFRKIEVKTETRWA